MIHTAIGMNRGTVRMMPREVGDIRSVGGMKPTSERMCRRPTGMTPVRLPDGQEVSGGDSSAFSSAVLRVRSR
jgi:hypothetical protein